MICMVCTAPGRSRHRASSPCWAHPAGGKSWQTGHRGRRRRRMTKNFQRHKSTHRRFERSDKRERCGGNPRIRPKICQELALIFKISRLKPQDKQSGTLQPNYGVKASHDHPFLCRLTAMDRSSVGGLHTWLTWYCSNRQIDSMPFYLLGSQLLRVLQRPVWVHYWTSLEGTEQTISKPSSDEQRNAPSLATDAQPCCHCGHCSHCSHCSHCDCPIPPLQLPYLQTSPALGRAIFAAVVHGAYVRSQPTINAILLPSSLHSQTTVAAKARGSWSEIYIRTKVENGWFNVTA